MEAQLSSTNYRRSPLIQGGPEIPCDVIVTMLAVIDNQLILEKYKKLVCKKYAEPKEEVIIGSFFKQNVITQTFIKNSKSTKNKRSNEQQKGG